MEARTEEMAETTQPTVQMEERIGEMGQQMGRTGVRMEDKQAQTVDRMEESAIDRKTEIRMGDNPDRTGRTDKMA